MVQKANHSYLTTLLGTLKDSKQILGSRDQLCSGGLFLVSTQMVARFTGVYWGSRGNGRG